MSFEQRMLVLALAGCLALLVAGQTQCEIDGTCQHGARMFPSQPDGPGGGGMGGAGFGQEGFADILKAGANMMQTEEGGKLFGDMFGSEMAGKLAGAAGIAGMAGGDFGSIAGAMGPLMGVLGPLMSGEGGSMEGMGKAAASLLSSGFLGDTGTLGELASTLLSKEGGLEKLQNALEDPTGEGADEAFDDIMSALSKPDTISEVREMFVSSYRLLVADSAAETLLEEEKYPEDELPEVVEEMLGLLEEDGDERAVPEVIQDYGYPCEVQNLTTSDGYKLSMHRIPHGREATNTKRPVVLLMHGLLQSSAAFVMDERSLAYTLAEAGYDVWLGNVRGNLYSREHTTLSVNSSEWWAWSWEQMAMHDLPAMIEHALQVTKADSLAYIGHSQGSTIGLAGFLKMPKELSQRVRVFIALAPVGNVPSTSNPLLKTFSEFKGEVQWAKEFGSHEIMPCLWETKKLTTACDFAPAMCAKVLAKMVGGSSKNFNETMIPFYGSHAPAGTSARNMAHWVQMFGSDHLRGFSTPGKAYQFFDLSESTVPLVAFSGKEDKMVPAEATEEFLKPHAKILLHRSIPGYGHLDFVYGQNAPEKLHPMILAALKADPTQEAVQEAMAAVAGQQQEEASAQAGKQQEASAQGQEEEEAPAQAGEEQQQEEASAQGEAAETPSAEDCKVWAAAGECQVNKEFMLSSCKEACQVPPAEEDCTKFQDLEEACPEWAKAGECEKNPDFMTASCRKSCSPCDPPAATHSCENRAPDSECAVWAQAEECTKNRDYMMLECKKACGMC